MGSRFTVTQKLGEKTQNTQQGKRFTVTQKLNANDPIVAANAEFNQMFNGSSTAERMQGFNKKYAEKQKRFEVVQKARTNDIVAATNKDFGQMFNGSPNATRTQGFKNYVEGSPIPSVNPTKKAHSQPSVTLPDMINMGNIATKIKNGEDLTTSERTTVSKYGINTVLEGSGLTSLDLSAKNNPKNISRFNRVKGIIDKKKKGVKLSDDENDALETFKLLNSREDGSMSEDLNDNARKLKTAKAANIYDNAAFVGNKVKLGSGELTPKNDDSVADIYKKHQRNKNRLNLYVDTGINQYIQGVNTTYNVILGKDLSDIANEGDSAYDIASYALKTYYKSNGEKLNSAIQDVVTNIANNTPGMAAGLVAGGFGLPGIAASAVGTSVFGVSVFGNSYKEGARLGVTNKEKLLVYALASTASECALEYAVGGVPGVGGVLSGEAISNLSKRVSSALAKASIKIAGNGAGEFVEEGVQSLLSPILQKYILGADVETVFNNPLDSLSSAAYEGFIGLLTSVLMGGFGSVSDAINESSVQSAGKYYNNIFKESETDIKSIAKYFTEVSDKNTELYKFSNRVVNGNVSDYAVGDMMLKAVSEMHDSNRVLLRKIGETVENSNGGLEAVIKSYETVVDEGGIFPEKVKSLYETVTTEPDVSTEDVGEFALSIQIYAPRAKIIGELLEKTDNADNVNLDSGENKEYNYGRGEQNELSDKRTAYGNNGERQGGQQNARANSENGRAWQEDQGDFIQRTERLSPKTGGGKRLLLKHGNAVLAYAERNSDNTRGSIAAQKLKNIGVDAVYCDGDIETNQNGKTVRHSEALTTPDGKVFISSNAALSPEHIAYHENVHVNDRLQTQHYADYESVLCGNLLYNSKSFEDICGQINDNQYGGKYDVGDPDSAKIFVQEIAAYVNEYVMTDPEYAEQTFGPMFEDWNAVTEAVHKFNTDTKADFSQPASFYAENGESIFSEPSARNPKYDIIEDWQYKSRGETRLTEDQHKIVNVGNSLGWTVKFDAVFVRDEKGKNVLDEKGIPLRADGSVDLKNKLITIDYDNKRPIQFIFKHELTHFGETSKYYNSFVETVEQSNVFENWLKSKTGRDDISVRLKAQLISDIISQRQNAGIKTSNSDARAELFADFVGDTLFTDGGSGLESITKYADVKQRGVIRQFLHDFISYIKKRISGNKEITFEISQLEDAFNRMLTDAAENSAVADTTFADSGINYSIAYTTDNKPVAVIDEDILEGVPKSQWVQTVKNVISSKFSDGIPISGRLIKVNKISRSEYVNSKYSQYLKSTDGTVYQDKLRAANNFEDIVLASTDYINEDLKHKRKDSFKEFARGDVLIRVGNNDYSAKVIVGFTAGKQMVLYDVLDFNKTSFNTKEKTSRTAMQKAGSDRNGMSSNSTVSQNEQSVNTNISDNTENDTPKYSIPDENFESASNFESVAELVRKYDNGEISKEEYYNEMRKEWQNTGERYGTIPRGENADTDYAVPKKTAESENTQRFVRTILETGELSEEMKNQIGAEILQGNFSYTPISDKAATEYAIREIDSGTGEKRWNAALASKNYNISKETVAIGEQMLTNAIKAGDNVKVLELSAELSDMLTCAGQVVQSARLLKKMNGVGRLVALQKRIEKTNASFVKRYGEKAPVITLDGNLANLLANSKTEAEIETAYRDAMQDISAQSPKTFFDKWNAWRYCAMLSNPRTHTRNLIGNTIFMPAVRIKDTLAFGLEKAVVSKDERTKSILIKKEYKDFAKNDSKSDFVKDLLSGQKYDERSEIAKYQRTFKSNVLEFVSKTNGNLLEAEDTLFKNLHYIHALGSFLQARSVDLKNVDEKTLIEARSYAVKEAQKATFNDESAVASYLKKVTQISDDDSFAVKALKVAADGVVPFKRTPVNIIRRGVEYSPLGLGKTLTKGLYDVKRGKISLSEFTDSLAAGLTGSAITAVGWLLGSLGYVTGGFDDDKEDKFRVLNGEQEYSIQVFGKSYTVDWAAPSSIPFFIGVEIASINGDGVKLSNLTDAMWNALEPITSLSMLSGIESTISAAKYSDSSQTFSSIMENIALNYAMQGIPSISGSIARTIDPTQRSWYTDKNSNVLGKFGQSTVDDVKSRIPVLSFTQIPKIDQWGRRKSRGGLGERLAENFVSPGYYSEISYDETNKELRRIVGETGNAGVLPGIAPKSFAIGNKTKYLTADEYAEYATERGRISFEYVEEFINSSAYQRLNDEQRAEVITDLYKYANARAKAKFSEYDITKGFKKVSEYEKEGISPVNYYIDKAIN